MKYRALLVSTAILLSAACEDKKQLFRQAIDRVNSNIEGDVGTLNKSLTKFDNYLDNYEPWTEGQFLGVRGTSLTVEFVNCLDQFQATLIDQEKIRITHLELLATAKKLDEPLTKISLGDQTELKKSLNDQINSVHETLKKRIGVSLAQRSECQGHYRKLHDFVASAH